MPAKTLKINFKGSDYVLEYTRRTIETMERQGFVASDLRDKPATAIPQLIRGAFLAHHRTLPRETIDEIYASVENKEAFIDKVSEMYNEPLEALFAEPSDDKKGNVTWEANF